MLAFDQAINAVGFGVQAQLALVRSEWPSGLYRKAENWVL